MKASKRVRKRTRVVTSMWLETGIMRVSSYVVRGRYSFIFQMQNVHTQSWSSLFSNTKTNRQTYIHKVRMFYFLGEAMCLCACVYVSVRASVCFCVFV